jgi:hypothetical protein
VGLGSEYFAHIDYDPFDQDYHTTKRTIHVKRTKKLYTCKSCGKTSLMWKEVDDSWRLYTLKGVLHTCKKYKREE